MGTTRRRTARFQQDWITQTHIDWLYDEPFDKDRDEWLVWNHLDRDDPSVHQLDTLDPPRRVPFLESAVAGRRLWGMYATEITEEHAQENPGTRPFRWWQFDAPEPRQRIRGIGTPRHECLADVEELMFGVPVGWITDDDIEAYVRINSPLAVPPVDPDDPPLYEAQAAYLERLGLLLPGERKRLKPKDFKPQSVIDMDIVEIIEEDDESP